MKQPIFLFRLFFIRHEINLSLFIFLGCLLFSCKKEPEFYPISDNFKGWFLFQNGSYWVFQNDSTGTLDSVYLTSTPKSYRVPGSQKSDPILEAIFVQYHSSFFEAIDVVSGISGNDYLSVIFFSTTNEILGLIYNLPVPGTYSRLYLGKGILFQNLLFYPNFELNIKNYNSVYQTRCTNINNYRTDTYNFYFAKNVGLIKLSGTWNDTTRSWSLIRHSVIQ
jgi:hypothetical protein